MSDSPRRPSVPRESPSPRLEAIVDLVGGVWGRLSRVWKALPSERRLAAFASLGLFLSLFLPWYQETVIARGVTNLRSLSDSLTGWGAFSFVEAAVLVVAAGVLVLLFVRAEGRAFHVPGGDGGVVTAAGAWACVLILWRMFDKEGTTGHGLYTTTSGIEWGIFVALAVAGVLTYAGTRIRLAHEPEPLLPGEPPRVKREREPAVESERSVVEGSVVEGSVAERSGEAAPEPASSRRMVSLDMDDTWIQVERSPESSERAARAERSSRSARPDSGTHVTRRRPRSLGNPDDTAPTAAPDPEDQLTLRLKRPD